MPRLDKFLEDILENTPHEGQFDDMKTFKEVKSNLKEAVASKTNLQYIRAKTAGNNHFEARRYIADQILRDNKLAMAYKALETIHDSYGRFVGNAAVQIRQRLEKMLMADLKRKVSNWDEVHSAL